MKQLKTNYSIPARLLGSSVAWSFGATALRLGGFLLILPLIVRYLEPQELGLWYVFLSMGSLGSMLELGFSQSLARSAGYLWAGARKLQPYGTSESQDADNSPNFTLLARLVVTMKVYYRGIAVILFLLQISLGTTWIFSSLMASPNYYEMLIAWLLYAFSISVNMTGTLWPGLLIGINHVAQSQRIFFVAILCNYGLTAAGMLGGAGLWALVAGNFLQAFLVQRVGHWAFHRAVGSSIVYEGIKPDWSLLALLWPMSWRSATIGFGAYLITQANTLVCGSYLGLAETASYGLSLQLISAIAGISSIWVVVKIPLLNQLRIRGETQELADIFILRLRLSLLTFTTGSVVLLLSRTTLLSFIGSQTHLLPLPQLALMLCFYFLEMHHSMHAHIVLTENRNPFVIPALASGVAVVLVSTSLTPHIGLWGILLSFGCVQLAFNNWWTVLKSLEGIGVSFPAFAFRLLGFFPNSRFAS